MTNITQIITALTTFPQRSQYVSSSAYALAVETWLGENKNLSVELSALVPQLNTFVSEANTLGGNVSISESNVTAIESSIKTLVDNAANYKGDWVTNYNSGVGYALSDSISYTDGNTYVSKVANNLVEPTSLTNTTEWYFIAKGFVNVAVTANYTASANEFLQVDTTTVAITVTLPLSPAVNDTIKFLDAKGTFDTKALTIARNGNTIMGVAEDMIVDTKNISFGLVFINNDWRLI